MPRARHVAVSAIACLAIGLVMLGLLSGGSSRHHVEPAAQRGGHAENDVRATPSASAGAATAMHARLRSAATVTRGAISTSPAAALEVVDLTSLRVTYENCVAGLPADGRQKRLHKIHWLHFPKCGTSLGTVVHGYLCKSEPSPSRFPQPGRRRNLTCDYCELEQMNKQGTPFWDGKIRALSR